MSELVDIELEEPKGHRPRTETVREALAKFASMLREEWFFDEVAEALAQGLRHETKIICKESNNGFVVALARSTRSNPRDHSFIRLGLE